LDLNELVINQYANAYQINAIHGDGFIKENFYWFFITLLSVAQQYLVLGWRKKHEVEIVDKK